LVSFIQKALNEFPPHPSIHKDEARLPFLPVVLTPGMIKEELKAQEGKAASCIPGTFWKLLATAADWILQITTQPGAELGVTPIPGSPLL